MATICQIVSGHSKFDIQVLGEKLKIFTIFKEF